MLTKLSTIVYIEPLREIYEHVKLLRPVEGKNNDKAGDNADTIRKTRACIFLE